MLTLLHFKPFVEPTNEPFFLSFPPHPSCPERLASSRQRLVYDERVLRGNDVPLGQLGVGPGARIALLVSRTITVRQEANRV